jgi:hypothetical protein
MGKKEQAEKARAKRLMDNYKLVPEQWERVYDYQDGRCAGCGQPFTKRGDTDHNHDDGLFRGILCSKCNPILGKFENAFVRTGLKALGVITRAQLLLNLHHYLLDPPATKALGVAHYGYPGRTNTKKHAKLLRKLRKQVPHTTQLMPHKRGSK